MALDPPPIREKTSDGFGVFPQAWVKWFNNFRAKYNQQIIWFDVNDLTTQTTQIVHTGGATTTLTNDGAGPFSTSYNFNQLPSLWDASSNSFDFSTLDVGDLVLLRFDIVVETKSNNQEVTFKLRAADGSPTEFTIPVYQAHFKAIGTYPITFTTMLYIGSDDVKSYPALVEFESADNADITVNGWLITRISV